MDSLRADVIFAFRMLRKSGVTSAAAILSLALAIGACTSAFRLIDALLLRPLPIAHPERLYSVSRMMPAKTIPPVYDGWPYAWFEDLRAAVNNQETLLAISFAEQVDVTYGSDPEMEKAHVQYVSGTMFDTFGVIPAAGRLLNANDRIAVAVLSHDYWSRRFAKDPNVIGRTFRLGENLYQIIGVTNGTFTGTEPGNVVDIFMPSAMHWGIGHEWSVFRIFAVLPPGVDPALVRDRLDSTLHAIRADEKLVIEPATAGVSGLQSKYRLSLSAIVVLVGLVLLIACANVANLMTAQSASRSREIAIRTSLGATRARLIQLLLIESALIAFLAASAGALFAWWSAPFVIGMISTPDNPVNLFLPATWRVLGFAAILTLTVTALSGLGPALRSSRTKPADPRSRRRSMRILIAAQTAFCFLVLFVAGLFVVTFERLSSQSTGIDPERVLTLYSTSRKDLPKTVWNETANHLRNLPGVEKVAIADWPILDGWGYRTSGISVDGVRPSETGAWFLYISSGMLDAMRMPFIEGRDFTENDSLSAIVNSTFARQYFNGEDVLGRWFEGAPTNEGPRRFQIIGVVRDARYRFLRQPVLPVAYLPFRRTDRGTFIVRTANPNPMAMAPLLRAEISRAQPALHVSNVRTQKQLIEWQTVREQLLGMLAAFFGVVALVLACVGLYGVLNYAVIERRKEIGIRMAIGARASDVARLVTVDISAMVLMGAGAGLALGLASARYLETLLFEVKATEAGMLMFPGAVLAVAAIIAAMPAVIHAVRIDPVETLRSE